MRPENIKHNQSLFLSVITVFQRRCISGHRSHEQISDEQTSRYRTNKWADQTIICTHKHLVPIAVFDGLTPPAKKRRPSATNNNNTLKLTPEHRSSLIICLIEHEIEYIVAPFEADSQIAIMDKLGLKTTEEQRNRKDSTWQAYPNAALNIINIEGDHSAIKQRCSFFIVSSSHA